MTSQSSLGAAIEAAINAWCSENGGGFSTGYVVAVDYINETGENLLHICTANPQATHKSMGLAHYLVEWFRDDAVVEFGTLREAE